MSYRALTRLRRLSQLVFFALFLFFPARLFLESDPLVAVAAALSTRALYKGLIWSLAVILPTLFLGRFVCGWVCPLGTLNHFVGNWKSEKKRVQSNRYKGWQRLKYYILIAVLAAALLGSSLGSLLDPISLTARMLAISTLPGLAYSLNALLLIAILALNLRITRFWCRALCPLGALLGWMSRWSILGLEKQPSRCEDCNRCLLHCQGGDDPIPGAKWRKAECHLCLNCVEDCPEGGLRFKFFPRGDDTVEGPNLQRRKALAGLAAGAAVLPLLRGAPGLLVRPPGALDEKDFLKRCVRCGECMRVCPNNALHPTLAQAGLEGIWTPVLVPRIGYCELSCTLCGQKCPTGAIWEFTLAQKGWDQKLADAKPIRIGTAFYDRGRCLPWSMATDCIVCEEWCPTSPKAIYLRPAEVVDSTGKAKQVRQPYVDPELCVGCGACEYACPVKDRPAIYVTSIGESRSRTNQLLLGGRTKPVASPLPNQVAGWSKSGDTRSFEADDLWRYIDGGAEKYIQAGVVRTLTAGYRYQNKTDAVADVYVMKSAEAATTIFESEPAAGSRPVALGEAARLYTGSLTFRQRSYFVRLVAMGECPPEALVALARGIAIP